MFLLPKPNNHKHVIHFLTSWLHSDRVQGACLHEAYKYKAGREACRAAEVLQQARMRKHSSFK